MSFRRSIRLLAGPERSDISPHMKKVRQNFYSINYVKLYSKLILFLLKSLIYIYFFTPFQWWTKHYKVDGQVQTLFILFRFLTKIKPFSLINFLIFLTSIPFPQITQHLSPFEQNVVTPMLKTAFQNTLVRIKKFVLEAGPGLSFGIGIYTWGEWKHKQLAFEHRH